MSLFDARCGLERVTNATLLQARSKTQLKMALWAVAKAARHDSSQPPAPPLDVRAHILGQFVEAHGILADHPPVQAHSLSRAIAEGVS
eukprot:CAMPEP_0117487374 /NCGR_PEP_ID=MMETSP0784-20121206/15962_1 /TAXON_ID=39447 /ORGANISM="" /LENGTH=87 /DNA_ID=CAMNT_0005282019 /DNA_START=84 /DNA_END=347 /DNA_ORIENTATION=+